MSARDGRGKNRIDDVVAFGAPSHVCYRQAALCRVEGRERLAFVEAGTVWLETRAHFAVGCMANGVHEGHQARCMVLTRPSGWGQVMMYRGWAAQR